MVQWFIEGDRSALSPHPITSSKLLILSITSGTTFLPDAGFFNRVKFATKEGVIILIKQFAGAMAAEEAAKYVPFVGSLVAGSIDFLVTKRASRIWPFREVGAECTLAA